jgi:hypothetical protein
VTDLEEEHQQRLAWLATYNQRRVEKKREQMAPEEFSHWLRGVEEQTARRQRRLEQERLTTDPDEFDRRQRVGSRNEVEAINRGRRQYWAGLRRA